MTRPLNIIVLCTGNSCRSIMAEALINDLGQGSCKAHSAGSNPVGFIHAKSIQTLKNNGIDPGCPRSKPWSEFSLQSFDIAICLCTEKSNKVWPVFPCNTQKIYWSIPDLSKNACNDEEVTAAFERMFLMIKEKVRTLVISLKLIQA
jgi:arsenate reductase